LIPSVVFAFFDIVDISVSDSTSCWNFVEENSLDEVKLLMKQQLEAIEEKTEAMRGSIETKEIEIADSSKVVVGSGSVIDLRDKKLELVTKIPMYIYSSKKGSLKLTGRALQSFAIKSVSGSNMTVVYLTNGTNHPNKSEFGLAKQNTIVTYNTYNGSKSYMLYDNGGHGQTLEIDGSNLLVECNGVYRGSGLRIGNKSVCAIPYKTSGKVKEGSESNVILFSTSKKGYSLYKANSSIKYPDLAIDSEGDYAAVIDGKHLYTFKWSDLKSNGKNAKYLFDKVINVNTMQGIAISNGYVYVVDNHEPVNSKSYGIKIYCYDLKGNLVSKTDKLWVANKQEAEGIKIYNGNIYVAINIKGKQFGIYKLT
jgi:hypothetical protein